MNNYLVSHALEQVWCAPDQDNQYIVRPMRITPNNGVINSYSFLWTHIDLPKYGTRFHLYQIGQIHPAFLNLPHKDGEWVLFSEVVDKSSVICDLYDDAGIHLPLSQTWFTVTREKALIIAVVRNPKLPLDFDKTQLYLRVYNNAYFASQRAANLLDSLQASGGMMVDNATVVQLQTDYAAKKTQVGGLFAFVNGWWVPAIDLVTTKTGDIAEFVHDSSVIRTIEFKLTTLPTFESTLDKKKKYLLHYTGADNDTIDYIDDLDLYLVSKKNQRGVYVHRNAKDAMRMVTHRDYAVPVDYVSAYLKHFQNTEGVVELDDLYLRLYVRNSGFKRKVLNGISRLTELYKLSDKLLLEAMRGVNSNVKVWQAASLEASAYSLLMSEQATAVTPDLVAQAYGYNTVAKLTGDSVHQVNAAGAIKSIAVPVVYQKQATVFEYDAGGLLLEWHLHTDSNVYIFKNTNTAYVEFVYGQASEALDDQTSLSTITMSKDSLYRAYVNDSGWVDITGTTRYFTENNKLVWKDTLPTQALVRSDSKFLCRSLDLLPQDGVLSFHLSEKKWNGTQWVIDDLEIPLGELDVFLNGNSLIEGLDYLVKFPFVAIINKKYLKNQNNVPEKVVFRFMGFCNSTLQRTAVNETGFIRNGIVSMNQQYDLRDEEVIRIVVDGRLKHPAQLTFDETGKPLGIHSVDNGKAYLIREMVVPLTPVLSTDYYQYREKSVETDKQISDYLTLKYPKVPYQVNPIADRYKLISPFFSALTEGLINDGFDETALAQPYDDEAVRTWCQPYVYLLEVDPVNLVFVLQVDYIVIHPHRFNTLVALTRAQYRFLNNAVRLYGNKRIDLSAYYTIN